MRDRIETLLRGALDFRIHTGPEPDGERRNDYLEAGRDAYEAEMSGFVLMKHRYPTAILAHTLNQMYPGFHAVGSIVLNTPSGGLNPEAVEASAQLGAKVVWMPTQDAGSIKLLEALDKVEAVLEIAKSYRMVVASTHSAFEEALMLARLAQSVGVERIVLTNPVMRFGSDKASQLLANDIYVELPFLSYYRERNAGERLRNDIETMGPGRCIVSSDFGQWTNPPPAEGMRMSIAAMLNAGMSDGAIAMVVRQNPLEALDIAVD